MKLDLGSFAFGSTVATGGNTPSWGTSLGQKKPALKFTYPGYDNILIGMMYKSIPTNKVFIPLGKGGRVCNSLEDEGIQLAALFDKVYINDIKVDAPFIMLIYCDSSESWSGRRTLKYNVKIEYRKSPTEIISNSSFVDAARKALQLEENACWVVSDIFIANQEELHFIAGIVSQSDSIEYPSAELRKTAFLEAIQTTYANNPRFIEKYSTESLLKSYQLPLQQIYYGAPGTGKSHELNRLTKNKEVVRTTFHPDSDYSTFVGAYKPTSIEIPVRDVTGKVIVEHGMQVTENRIVYEFVEQSFLQAYIKAWNAYIDASEGEKPEDIYLVIEEINRGNCAQIFGDLFQLLDRNDAGFSDYPIQADKDIKKQISKVFKDKSIADAERINSIYEKDIIAQVLSGEKLLLPDNLYIWATMNTSDQSLFPIDSAFKRRWDWQYTPICEGKSIDGQPLGWIINVNGKDYDWWAFVQIINDEINELTKSEDKKLGYFFCKPVNGIISSDIFVGKVIFYLWNDVFKDQDLGSIFHDNEGKELSFNSFYDVDVYGKPVVKEEIVEMFLNNLELKPINVEVSEINLGE